MRFEDLIRDRDGGRIIRRFEGLNGVPFSSPGIELISIHGYLR